MTPAARPVVVSWSGGKDSAMALHRLRQDPGFEVTGLMTTVTDGYDRVSIHGIRRNVLRAQADAIGLPLTEVRIPPAASNEIYEAAFLAALAELAAQQAGTRTIAFGDLFLADVRAYRERLLAASPWTPVFPIWGENTATLAQRFIDEGFSAILCCVDTTQLRAAFAGRHFDQPFLAALPAGVDPCGENGEFHTCVFRGPVFRRPLVLKSGERVLRDERFQYVDLQLA